MQETWFNSRVGKIWRKDRLPTPVFLGCPGGSAGKKSACNVGDLGLIPGLGRSSGEGKGYPLQYSGLENPMDSIVHGVAKSRTQLSNCHIHTYQPLEASLACVPHALEPRSLSAVEKTEVQGESGSVIKPWLSSGALLPLGLLPVLAPLLSSLAGGKYF